MKEPSLMVQRNARASSKRYTRPGAALVELVIILPLLAFVFVASADFARAFHDLITITDCARNGSIYAFQNTSLAPSAYQAGITAAALADAGGMGSTPTVTTSSGSLGVGNNYVNVTVSNPFQTLTPYPGIPSTLTISRTIQMRVQPAAYRMK